MFWYLTYFIFSVYQQSLAASWVHRGCVMGASWLHRGCVMGRVHDSCPSAFTCRCIVCTTVAHLPALVGASSARQLPLFLHLSVHRLHDSCPAACTCRCIVCTTVAPLPSLVRKFLPPCVV